MIFELIYVVVTQTVLRLAADQFIDEICSLVAPTVRDLVLFQLDVSG